VSIPTQRLTLEPATLEFIRALNEAQPDVAEQQLSLVIEGDWFNGPQHWMRLRMRQLNEDPTLIDWLMHAMVLRDGSRVMVGNCGYHNRPDATGMVEIGYQVAPPYRRQGYALEAARALVDNAFTHQDVTRVRACVSPTNEPSLNLIAQLGFVRVGEQMDEVDGLEYVFEVSRLSPA
jgi:[ribosomal protein S5]-alanine N-acetyltransferase